VRLTSWDYLRIYVGHMRLCSRHSSGARARGTDRQYSYIQCLLTYLSRLYNCMYIYLLYNCTCGDIYIGYPPSSKSTYKLHDKIEQVNREQTQRQDQVLPWLQ